MKDCQTKSAIEVERELLSNPLQNYRCKISTGRRSNNSLLKPSFCHSRIYNPNEMSERVLEYLNVEVSPRMHITIFTRQDSLHNTIKLLNERCGLGGHRVPISHSVYTAKQ